jgi:dipeptidyl aminopeptidase/acylaminoacyl peptidase
LVVRALLALALALVTVAFAAPAQATYPGHNGSLVFTTIYNHGPGTSSVSVGRVGPRHGTMRSVLFCGASSDPDCVAASTSSVSPDGHRIALLTIGGIGPPFDAALRVVPLGPGETRVVDLADPFRFPAWFTPRERALRWLPTGDRLSVQLLSQQNEALTVALGVDGALGEQLLPAGATAVDWAIDDRAAFIRAGNLHVAGPGGRERRLTSRGAGQPSWSPHGRWIAFTRSGSVFVVPSAGGKARRLTAGSEPVWAPDGRSIAFLRRGFDRRSRDLGAASFYLYSWRTERTRRLTQPLAGESAALASPDWQPLPR